MKSVAARELVGRRGTHKSYLNYGDFERDLKGGSGGRGPTV
jgi:hypothetical protein